MRSKFLSHWHVFTTFFMVLLMLQPALALAADDKDEIWYQIEIIIAKRGNKVPTLEAFPFQPAPISWHRGRTLAHFDPELSDQNELENVEFILLPKDQHILNNEAQALENHEDYEVLVHQSWRQILKSNKAIYWIDIKGNYTWAGHHQLEGSLGFSKGRYLHIHSELHLNQFPAIKSVNRQHTIQKFLSERHSLAPIIETRYSLVQRRKMRSKELHYLDHPKLVLLVKVIPFTPAEPILEAIPVDEPKLIDLTAPSAVE